MAKKLFASRVVESTRFSQIGCLIVITGASGAGKDTIKDGVLDHADFISLGIKNVVTCTDRPPRLHVSPPEIPGVTYHFVTTQELKRMEKAGELVEPVTSTGSSSKATPKKEIARLFKGENLFWRIDPSRAAQVATGEFFDIYFPEHSEVLKKRTVVICITAPKETVDLRRKIRDGDKYNPEEYILRDKQEEPFLKILEEKAVIIDNYDGMVNEIVEKTVKIIVQHHDKIKNKKSK